MHIHEENQNKWMELYQSYLHEISLKEYDFYVSVTRKGYYFMKIQPNFQGKIVLEEKLLRDRDIIKKYSFKEFRKKRILLFDDTASTGETLKELKTLIEDKTNYEANVDISAFAVSSYVLQYKDSLFENSKLLFYCLLDEENMAEFSLYELHQIHDAMIPYVVDLPFFEKINFSKEEFESLICKNRVNWGFYDYTFKIQDKEYKNGFFIYENNVINQIFGDSLLACIVKCRYRLVERMDKKEEYEVVFTPFTMLKSVDYFEMTSCAKSLYKGTAYSEILEGKSNHNTDYVGIYRDVVYNLSCFVGWLFKENISFSFGKELKWQYNLTKSVQNEKLENSIREIFGQNFTIQNYLERLKKCKFSYWRNPNIHIRENTENDFEKIRNYILGQLSLKKLEQLKERFNETSEEKYKKIEYSGVLFEEIESMMAEKFSFKSIKEFRNCFIKIVLLALDCSFMSNALIEKNGEIKRVFNYGECSEIYFGYDIRLFYLAVYSYYNNVKATSARYQKHYQEFLVQLYAYLQYNGYFKFGYIAQEDFSYFSEYFNLEGAILDREIRNKMFLLYDEYAKNPYNVSVMKFVSNLKFD